MKVVLFKIAQKFTLILKKIRHQEVKKIAQSGHSGLSSLSTM